jgi:cytochrome oxidase Cu insertion factor (SCO1/SenC/PrrC family)
VSAPVPGHPRRTLLLLVLLFFAPLALAFLMYYGSGWRPAGRTNHGELIEPPRTLPEVSLSRSDGAPAASVLRARWSLVYVGAGDCAAACRRTLYYMQQTHLALGNAMPRVQRVFLATRPCCDISLRRQYPDLITLDASAPAAAALLAQFPPERDSGIFIVDPRGNLMMRYDANQDPKGLREDLKKLLDLSHIG